MEIDPNDRCQNLVHSLLIGYIWISLAPDKEDVGQQLKDAGILEECELLVSTEYILPDLLVEETVGFLYYFVLTPYFFSGLSTAFIKGFLGTDKGPYFPIDLGTPLD